MDNRELAQSILKALGNKENILTSANCMTRIRVTVRDPAKADINALKQLDGVIGVVSDEPEYIQVVIGPGRVTKIMSELETLGIGNAEETDWKKNRDDVTAKQNRRLVSGIRVIADIFTPMIPAFIASGICSGLAKIIGLCIADSLLPDTALVNVIQQLLTLISDGFLSYLAVFTGVNSAKQFGVSPMLGGMLGAASISTAVNKISEIIGWYNAGVPNDSILVAGTGGILGVIAGVWVLSLTEKQIHKHMPEVLDITFTPLLSMMIVMPVYVLMIMPVSGFVSTKLAAFLSLFMYSDSLIVSALTGYALGALFLPLVLLGLHRGFVPIYALQIEKMGGTTLFPAVAMAGAGQVGAAIALYFKAKKAGNRKLASIISGALPAGILGIGEPLIYGVTLPLVKPFFTAGLGAGFGGAWCMIRHVMSTGYNPSGILGMTIMVPEKMIDYLIGILISYIMGALLTWIFIPAAETADFS